MKKMFFIAVSALIGLINQTSLAQISFNRDSISFKPTTEIDIDSISLTIYNNNSKPISIQKFKFFNTYKNAAFFVKNNNPFQIESNDSAKVFIYFKPIHNVFHNSELIIITEPSIYSKTIDIRGQGKYSIPYYASTENKTEEDLKATLKNITGLGYVSLGYNDGRDKMFMLIDNQKVNGQGASVNTLDCIYTGKKSLAFTTRTESQTNDNFNTEHTFPQGYFSQNEPMRSDLHHLFPTNDAANNSRSNYAFGVASTPYVNEAVNTPSHLGSNTLYEPRDVQKGKTARAMMYFVLRYTDYTNFFAPQENILREWNQKFPPNSIEKKRNSDIQLYQKNRNPFVDYPAFADRITKLVANSTSPLVNSAYWLDTIRFNALDTKESLSFLIPFINNGNQKVSLFTFSSIDTNISFINSDTIKIENGEANYLAVKVNTKNKSGLFTSTINFNTNYASGANFVLRYEIDSVKSGIEHSTKNNFYIYPNPTNSTLNLTAIKSNTYSILNIIGEEIMNGNFNIGLNIIPTDQLLPGMYIIRSESSIVKFIKQ